MSSGLFIEQLERREFFSATAPVTPAVNYVPASIAGLTFHCKVLAGTSPYASAGTFSISFNSRKLTYTLAGGTGIQSTHGKYTFTKTTTNHAKAVLHDNVAGVESVTVTFTSRHSGTIVVVDRTYGGTQKSKFSF